MSATEELRRLLDECGLSCQTHYLNVSWRVGSKLYVATDILDGTLTVTNLTPEQAIAATLGNGECTPHGEWESISQSQEVRHVFCDCGYALGMDERDSWPFKRTRLFAMPNYCQECGRKIRKVVGK